MRWMWILVVAGCGEEAVDPDTVATAAEGDVAEIARAADDMVGALTARGALIDITESFTGVGTCVWTWNLTGTVGDLTYTAAIDEVPCGGSYDGVRLDLDYTVTEGRLNGEITKGAADWSYSLSGARSASLTVDTLRRDAQTYTGDWTLDSLTGTTNGYDPGPFDAELTYTGFAGGTWTLEVSRTADLSITGTLTGPEGTTCTVSGSSAEDVQVDCNTSEA